MILTFPGHEDDVIIDAIEHALKDYLELPQAIVEIKHSVEPVQTSDTDEMIGD